jgi:hypothetical protein
MNPSHIFVPGTLTFILDASFGSSGKGKLAAFITKHQTDVSFLVTSNSANASHTVIDGGKQVVFKALPSGSFYHERLERVFISPGASFKIVDLLNEIEQTGIPRSKVMIHPRASVITDLDAAFERGEVDLDGVATAVNHSGTIKTGSTCSGSGASLAKKILRRNPSVAADYPEISDMIGVTEEAIMDLLDSGLSGLFEVGQGFPLSLNHHRFAPNTTSRNVTVSSALNDAMLPPMYAGPVILNFRTYPIRINSKKFIGVDGSHLTWEQVKAGTPHFVVDSYSGNWYPDQEEITWEDIEKASGGEISDSIKNTTLTKLPRRVATFSALNLAEAIRYNASYHGVFLSLNFMNHVSNGVTNATNVGDVLDDDMVSEWIECNIPTLYRDSVAFLGTGQDTDAFAIEEFAIPYCTKGTRRWFGSN